jgi:hypothetical protein
VYPTKTHLTHFFGSSFNLYKMEKSGRQRQPYCVGTHSQPTSLPRRWDCRNHQIRKEPVMSTKPTPKRRPKTRKVTFTLPAEVDAQDVALCGDFNAWSSDSIKLARNDGGEWEATVGLQPGRAYRYRYLLDGRQWENAWHADQYIPNPYGGDDSVLVVE